MPGDFQRLHFHAENRNGIQGTSGAGSRLGQQHKRWTINQVSGTNKDLAGLFGTRIIPRTVRKTGTNCTEAGGRNRLNVRNLLPSVLFDPRGWAGRWEWIFGPAGLTASNYGCIRSPPRSIWCWRIASSILPPATPAPDEPATPGNSFR